MIAYVWRLTPIWPDSFFPSGRNCSHRCSFLRCSCWLRARFSASMISINFWGSFSCAASSASIRHSASWGTIVPSLSCLFVAPAGALRNAPCRSQTLIRLMPRQCCTAPHIPTKKSRGISRCAPRERDVAEIILGGCRPQLYREGRVLRGCG